VVGWKADRLGGPVEPSRRIGGGRGDRGSQVILYPDTSALVKLYVSETGSAEVRSAVDAASHVATSRVAYPEARAALAHRGREGQLDAHVMRRAVADLERDLAAYVVVEVSPELAALAGSLAEDHALRGFDALHVASALRLATTTACPSGSSRSTRDSPTSVVDGQARRRDTR
jgi:predicted nucleic acid-binding protein